MVKFQKVLLIIGCVASLLDCVVRIYGNDYDVAWQFISASLFFASYLNVKTIDMIEKNN
jgi:hypothetical protein